MRSVDSIRILVDHPGMPADALGGFPRGQLSREKALHASTDEERFFILQVQARQYGEIAARTVTHMYIVRIPGALSIHISQQYGEIRERDDSDNGAIGYANSIWVKYDTRKTLCAVFGAALVNIRTVRVSR